MASPNAPALYERQLSPEIGNIVASDNVEPHLETTNHKANQATTPNEPNNNELELYMRRCGDIHCANIECLQNLDIGFRDSLMTVILWMKAVR